MNLPIAIDPRLEGIREHLNRAIFLQTLAAKQDDASNAFRLLLSAVYSARAIVELLLETAFKQQLKGFVDADLKKSRDLLEEYVAPQLPYFYLIERIRIHDFHRFGLVPPASEYRRITFAGPAKLTAQKGTAAFALTNEGPVTHLTGTSQIKLHRPLLIQDGKFFDDESKEFVSLEVALDAYLNKVPDVLLYIEKLTA